MGILLYDDLLGQGFNPTIASKLDQFHIEGIVDELDDRALEALREFSEDDALRVLQQFAESDFTDVQDRSAFFCGVMKTYRAKMNASTASAGDGSGNPAQGPNEEKIKELLRKTGYTLDITTGQRKYGGPPPGWEGPVPGTGQQKIFIGKLPRDMYEDELVPLLEPYGPIYELLIMIDPFTGFNKGFAFCTYATAEHAQAAVKGMDQKEVRAGKRLGVSWSHANNRLFVGSIPKSKTKKDIYDEFAAHLEHLTDVIVYPSSDGMMKNRGFAFLDFKTFEAAKLARRRLMSGSIQVFGGITPTADWADPVDEPGEDGEEVKVVYVRNLSPAIDEVKLNELFQQHGPVEKVKKLRDFAFIHFVNRADAMRAITEMDGLVFDDLKIKVTFAEPATRSGRSGVGSLNPASRGRGGGPVPGSGGGYGDNYGSDSDSEGYDEGYGFKDPSPGDYYGPNAGIRGGRGGAY